jgi:NADH:ubiquinone oxidoreductase subunit 2 (subunit N)
MRSIYIISILFLIIRFVIALAIGQYYYTRFVRNFRANLSSTVENKNVAEENEQEETNETG